MERAQLFSINKASVVVCAVMRSLRCVNHIILFIVSQRPTRLDLPFQDCSGYRAS
jgi:hypothetical protein